MPQVIRGTAAVLLACVAPAARLPAQATTGRASATADVGASANGTDSLPLDVFSYDRSAPLDLRDSLLGTDSGIALHAISYASPKGGRATGVMLVPQRPGPHAGIIFQHGMPGSARGTVPHIRRLAALGAVVVAIDAPFARRGGSPVTFTEADSSMQVQLIVDLQRAVDLLLARRDVDPGRLAYIGRSYGGAMGALVAGVERRLKGVALQVGDGGLVSHFTGPDDNPGPLDELPEAQRRRWLAAMTPIEPIRYVHRANAALFLQSGRTDRLVPAADAGKLHQAAGPRATVRWYDAGHGLEPRAERDLAEWLHRTVGTAPPG
ncbi:MAG TPA: alpha/beta fold hydrolase [Gemmatimonadales bacterium]|nr:alpha/beta fold hydrolase [Gemmatimonadales bacterium]